MEQEDFLQEECGSSTHNLCLIQEKHTEGEVESKAFICQTELTQLELELEEEKENVLQLEEAVLQRLELAIKQYGTSSDYSMLCTKLRLIRLIRLCRLECGGFD